jgi:hypothetical protein
MILWTSYRNISPIAWTCFVGIWSIPGEIHCFQPCNRKFQRWKSQLLTDPMHIQYLREVIHPLRQISCRMVALLNIYLFLYINLYFVKKI